MQFLMTWNPDEAYKVTKDIALRLAYGGSVVRSHMEGDIKVIDEFTLHSISVVRVPGHSFTEEMEQQDAC